MSLEDTIFRGIEQLTDRGMFATDTALTIIAWNEWLIAQTGLSKEHVLGKNLLDLFPDLAHRRLDGAFRRALDGQVSVLSQRLHAYLLPMPPVEDLSWTTQMQQSVRIAPLVEEQRIVGTIAVIEDVTDRVQHENELAARARQQTVIAALAQQALSGCEVNDLMASAAQGVAETLSVDQCGIWEFAPERGQAVLRAGVGWKPDALGTAVPAASPDVAAGLSDAPLFAAHRITSATSALVSAGTGPFGWLGVYATDKRVFDDDDYQFIQTVANAIGMAVDRKRLETELRRRADELAEADRRKDEFLAMLAHELRNPLAPILHAVQLVGMPGASADDLRASHTIIRGQVEQMARLVDDLLDVSRITRGQITLRMEPIQLSDVIMQAVESCRPLIESNRHTLEVLPSPEPLEVRGDATRLVQVVTNLLNNAAKYTDEGGHIWLALARDGENAVVSVRDSGIGISPDMLPRIFDLFTQAARSLARSQGGLGIGLTLVRRLVELHGGSILAHSGGLGQGSEFAVRLPLAVRAATPPPQAEQAPAASMRGLRVLVVDDNADAADSLAMLLKAAGHEPQVAYEGRSAIVCAETREFDVVFLDIGLPGMDGYEVARRLRQQRNERLRLVALTGYGQPDDRETSRRAGFDHHLVKPVSFAHVQQALAELCSASL